MKYAISPLAFAVGSSALAIRGQSQQCVQLQASGGASGTLGQLSDGQNRVGGGHSAACYCLDGNGGFTDSNGRGCILTPPTTQFQCDSGASPTNGFAINGGSVTYNGSSKFYACPVNDNNEYNVYTQPAPGQDKCVEITLSAGQSCGGGNGGGASASSSQPAQSQPAQSQPPKASQPPASQPGYSAAPQQSQPPMESQTPKPSQSAPSQPGYSVPPKESQPPASQPPKESQSPAPSQPGYTVPPKESQPPKQSQPASSKPAPSQPAQSQSAPSQPGYSVPPQSQSAASKPAPTQPASSKPAQSQPVASQPGYSVPPQSQSAPSKPAPSQPAQSSPPSNGNGNGTGCPADLNGEYQYPHLIVPVSSSQPSNAPGTSYNGKANGDVCSLFNFDIPQSYSGHSCSLVFLFPEQKDLETSSYTVSGSGGLEFSKCDTNASQKTSWDNKGTCTAVKTVDNVAPGNSYTIVSDSCAAGQTVTYQMCSTGGLSLEYFQDYNPSPIGAYVREC
ncbi:uncharacterized protein N0V89_011501 [Didymosphaeria variabile]|uniref:Ubiquitin 3 binding protein But2 C-terminal domain-containing protein n=1 Tax=Didymosphaeria variabile TaxID=1932322 RepID=A0A9W8X9X0_9PLEO|nr:uncharacterized protein N0V89_011501 [Didymosphaeria variabile]KAJ4345371.1 hypothetical protein N0V89_011501 [Didymosphaeria variabile]